MQEETWMSILPDEVHEKITVHCSKGDDLVANGDLATAATEYQKAWALLPEPREEWEAATWIMTALGDTYYMRRDFCSARESFRKAMECPNGIGNPFLHLRLGQCAVEIGDTARAADELARAYMGGGKEIFEDEDPKYFEVVKSVLRQPDSGW
jgi:tetratricopeptide (TPR) repeat protein